ncbi:MAG: tRNA (adenosine(37)-N6)-threonylcarbamoyltransferase complex dimerization subunit type 1 TsaB [Candidatus Dormibacteria bacterium]
MVRRRPNTPVTVLAIDTSARRRSVCVTASVDGSLERADVRVDTAVDIALPQAIAALPLADIDSVVVVIGPGSYTGVRAGMAAGLGIAHARSLPLYGASALEVVAAGAVITGASDGVVLTDAGRGGVYLSHFSRRPALHTDSAVRVARTELHLDGASAYSVDAMDVTGLQHMDPAVSLAAVVPVARGREGLARHDLQAIYIE